MLSIYLSLQVSEYTILQTSWIRITYGIYWPSKVRSLGATPDLKLEGRNQFQQVPQVTHEFQSVRYTYLSIQKHYSSNRNRVIP